MIIVRVLTAIAKPALVSGTLTAVAAGGWFAYDSTRPHDPPTAFQQVQTAGQRLLISEFGDHTDNIVALDPANPATARTEIATIDHARGYGVFPVLSPDGEAVAYTALPPDTEDPSPSSSANAAIVGVDGSVTLLADDVDLLVPPVWSPDSKSVVVRKNTPSDDGAGSFELLLLGIDGSRTSLSTWQSAAAFPIAFSTDGAALYFATLNNDGTDLYSVAPDGTAETHIAHLADEIARDWRLSPDGTALAFSVADSGRAPAVITRRIDLTTAAISDVIAPSSLDAGPPSTGVARGEFNPAWRRDGDLTVASLQLDGGSEAISIDDAGAIASQVTQNADGIDLPLGWSPDGETLVVRSVEGKTPFDAGRSYVELVRGDVRVRLSDSADVLIVGWLP